MRAPIPVPRGFAAAMLILFSQLTVVVGNPLTVELPDSLREHLIDPVTVPKNPPFAAGEHLRYKLGWSLFTVARSTLDVDTVVRDDGRDALKISVLTRTNSFADAFYKVRNLSTTWVAPDVSRSFEYIAEQDEGDRQRDVQVLFDTADNTVRHYNRISGEMRDPVLVMPGTFDPVAIVFFIRSIDFEVGDQLVVPTTNGKEFFYTIVHVRDKVKKRFQMGKREAFVLEPDIKDVGGVFKKSPDGRIRFYISADEQRLPLRMESEVAVGKFWADLVEVLPPESVAVPEVEGGE